MNKYQKDVAEFHDKFGARVATKLNVEDREVRAKLILEEAVETAAALGFNVGAYIEDLGIPGQAPFREVARYHKTFYMADVAEVVDGLCDLLYVAFGTAVSMGVDLDPFWDEVHRSNMAKEGGGKREDGKILKPEGWTPPRIHDLLSNLRALQDYREREANGS